jgi:hypothetical protein
MGANGARAPRRRRLLIGGLAAFVVVALVAGVATRGHLWGPRKADNAATAADPRELGAGVTVVNGEVPDGLAAKMVARGMKVDRKLARPVGKTVDIGPSGPLPGPMTLQFTLDRQVPKNAVVIVFTREGGKGPWRPLATKLTPDRRHSQVTVNHLSWFTSLWLSAKGIVEELKQIFHDVTSSVVEDAKAPRCEHAQDARNAGYTAAHSGSDSLLWCLDDIDGRGALRLVNNRRYPLLLRTKRLDWLAGTPSSNAAEDINKMLTFDGIVSYPRDDAVFGADLPRGQRGSVEAVFDSQAQLLTSLYVGVKAMLALTGKFGLFKQPNEILKWMELFLDVDVCRRAGSGGEILASCFTDDLLKKAVGSVWGPILSFIMTAAAVADYFRGALNALWDQLGDRSDTKLTLVRHDTGRFVGQWRVHGWQLEIRADGTASTTWNAGLCGPVTCTGHGELTWKPIGGNIVLTYQRTWLTINPGNTTAPDDWGTVPDPTGSFELAWREQGLLERVDPDRPGNPFWCGEGLAESQLDKCGA